MGDKLERHCKVGHQISIGGAGSLSFSPSFSLGLWCAVISREPFQRFTRYANEPERQ